MAGRDIRKDLETTPAEGAVTVLRTIAGAVPLVGSPLAELVNATLGTALIKRRDTWLIYVADGLKEIQARFADFDPQNLKDNEQFTSAVVQTINIAIRNHQKDKLEALRNALLNTAVGINIDDNLQLIFIEAIDRLTPLHLRTLKYFDNPTKYLEENNIPRTQNITMGSRSMVLELALPELKGHGDLSKMLVNDLSARGFLSDDSRALTVTVTGTGMFGALSSGMGKEFLRYITAP